MAVYKLDGIAPAIRAGDWHAEAVALYVDNIRRYRSPELLPDGVLETKQGVGRC